MIKFPPTDAAPIPFFSRAKRVCDQQKTKCVACAPSPRLERGRLIGMPESGAFSGPLTTIHVAPPQAQPDAPAPGMHPKSWHTLALKHSIPFLFVRGGVKTSNLENLECKDNHFMRSSPHLATTHAMPTGPSPHFVLWPPGDLIFSCPSMPIICGMANHTVSTN